MEGLRIVNVELSEEARSGVMVTALEAGTTYGIGYWATVITVDHATIEGKLIIRKLVLDDHEGAEKGKQPKRYTLDGESIRRAIQKMFAEPEEAECGTKTLAQLLREDYPDGPASDIIIQVACFGKVLYG